jgi:hypothetical protein
MMTIASHIDVRPDRGRWPLWVSDGSSPPRNTDPAALSLPAALVSDLRSWARAFDAASPGFAGPDAEDEFWMTGRVLAGRVAVTVAGNYRVQFFDGRLGGLSPVLSDGGTRIDGGRVILPSHWRDVSGTPEVGDGLAAELGRELSVGHVLAGRHTTVLARCDMCDDVLIPVADDAYAVVHLTWQRGSHPNWPSVEVHAGAGALLADLSDRHH